MKKILSLLLFTLVFTMGATSFATTNLGIEDSEITPNIGGGPSPSGAWEYETDFYHSFSYTEVKEMSANIQDVMDSSKYEAGEIAYDTSIIAASLMGRGIGLVSTSYQGLFGKSYFSEIQDSANSLADATANHSEGDNILLKITKYHRPANGDTMFIMDYND